MLLVLANFRVAELIAELAEGFNLPCNGGPL
jgi:hypothetical protein